MSDEKTTSEILALCDGGNIIVNASRWAESWARSEPWRVTLKAKGDGVGVEGEGKGKSFDEALGVAWGKIAPFTAVPAGRRLLAPQLVESKALQPSSDIPF